MPPVPEKTRNNRTFSRGWAFNPPRHSFEESPPNYSFWDVTGPKGEKLTDVRNNKYIAQRGGWRRICLIFFLVLVAILALATGLGVGLDKNHNSRYVAFLHRLRRMPDTDLGTALQRHQPPRPLLNAAPSLSDRMRLALSSKKSRLIARRTLRPGHALLTTLTPTHHHSRRLFLTGSSLPLLLDHRQTSRSPLVLIHSLSHSPTPRLNS